MEQLFQQVVNSQQIDLEGIHFASLINAYGCVVKDLDKALAAYNSIFDHPRKPVVDSTVFEALANVCVLHRRIDLMSQIIPKMNDVGVHMTADIANVMIKGYAAMGDIESSRSLFESFVDPPQGIAASHNLAPHDPSSAPSVNLTEPVYREVGFSFFDISCFIYELFIFSRLPGKPWCELSLILEIVNAPLH